MFRAETNSAAPNACACFLRAVSSDSSSILSSRSVFFEKKTKKTGKIITGVIDLPSPPHNFEGEIMLFIGKSKGRSRMISTEF